MKVKIENRPALGLEVTTNYREANLRLPLLSSREARTAPHLAIVGSGPSLRKHFRELQDFQGDVWAINGAWRWLQEHGLETTFFSADPLPIVAEHSRGTERLILSAQCDPLVFAQHMAYGAKLFRFDALRSGLSSCSAAIVAALECGYDKIVVYGCECSSDSEILHVDGRGYEHEGVIEVGVGEESFFTRPAYYYQALELSKMIGGSPQVEERSGGLLGALVGCYEGPRYEVFDFVLIEDNPDLGSIEIPLMEGA